MEKQDLINKMNEELFESEINDKEFFVLSLIKQHFEENYNDKDNAIIKALAEYQNPLEKAYQIFNNSVNIDKILEKVYQDFFDNGQTEKVRIYCDELEDENVDEEDFDTEDEGLIHDNEDC